MRMGFQNEDLESWVFFRPPSGGQEIRVFVPHDLLNNRLNSPESD